MSNAINAVIRGADETVTEHAWQWDYGQVLTITGIELPEVYEVHFSNQSLRGDAYIQLGNEDGVQIPDELLTTGMDIHAYIYLHTGNSDGETEYKIRIPVDKRPQPTSEEPTPEQQNVITEAIAALQDGVTRSEAAQEAAEDAAEAAEAAAATVPEDYGEALQDIINLKADLTEVDNQIFGYEPVTLTGSQLGSYIISDDLEIGDTFAKTANSWRKLYSAPVSGGTYWILNCGLTSSNYFWCAVDASEIVVALSAKAIANTDSCNCKVVLPDTAKKLYWIVTQTKSVLIRDNGKFEVLKGNELKIPKANIITSNATLADTGVTHDGNQCISAVIETSGYIDIPLTSDRYINIGVWVKLTYAEATKVTSVKIYGVYGNSTTTGTTIPTERLQCDEWVFISVYDTVSRSDITGVRISPVFATGQTSVSMFVCRSIYTDFLSRSLTVINFDNAWQASEDCGAYDLLINNNIPFTITGTLEGVDAQTKEKLLACHGKGLLEIGTYGNEEYDGVRYPISASTDAETCNTSMFKVIDEKSSIGVVPKAFGPQNHLLGLPMLATVNRYGYDIIRCYGVSYSQNVKYSKGLISLTETHTSIGQANLSIGYGINNGVLGTFAHGVSSNPSGETNPNLYTQYSAFSTFITTLLKAIEMGVTEPVTMSEAVRKIRA